MHFFRKKFLEKNPFFKGSLWKIKCWKRDIFFIFRTFTYFIFVIILTKLLLVQQCKLQIDLIVW